MEIYVCREVTCLQHTQLLDLAWLPASQISEKLRILETLELCVNAVDMGIKVNGCLCSKPQLLIPTLSSILSQPPNVPVSMCVHQSSVQAGQVFPWGPCGSHISAPDTVAVLGTGYVPC